MRPGLIAAALGVVGGLLLVRWALFFVGKDRSLARWYFDRISPWYVRHIPFATAAITFILWFTGAAGLAFDAGYDILGGLATVGFGATTVAALRILRAPPEFLKPSWLREQEGKSQSADTLVPNRDDAQDFDPWLYWALVSMGTLVALVGAYVTLAHVRGWYT